MEREEFRRAASPGPDPNTMTGANAAAWMASQAGG